MIEQFVRFTWFQAGLAERVKLVGAALLLILAPAFGAWSTSYGAFVVVATIAIIPAMLGWSALLLADFVADFKYFRRSETGFRL